MVAKTVPEEDRENKYQYEWTSLLQPEGSTAVKHQNDNELHLEKLSEGTYAFRVIILFIRTYSFEDTLF